MRKFSGAAHQAPRRNMPREAIKFPFQLLSYPLFRETQARKIDKIVAFGAWPFPTSFLIRISQRGLFPPEPGKFRFPGIKLPVIL
jgi:hypothetical protein